MTCPSIDRLLAGAEGDHAAGCFPCRVRVVEVQSRLALAIAELARVVGSRAEARALRDRAAGQVSPLQQRGGLAYEFRDLPGRIRGAD